MNSVIDAIPATVSPFPDIYLNNGLYLVNYNNTKVFCQYFCLAILYYLVMNYVG